MHLKQNFFITLLGLFALTLTVTAEETKNINLMVMVDGETIEFSGEELDAGETRQFFTENGKEALITRTEDGYSFEIDGKELDLGLGGEVDIDVDGKKRIVVHRAGGTTADKQIKIVTIGDEDGEIDLENLNLEGLAELGDDLDITVLHADPAQKLIDSGALDGLDDATRQRILDALGNSEVEVHSVVRFEEEIEEDTDSQ